MSTLLTSRWLRWAVPGGVAAAVAAASFGGSVAASASGRPDLPVRTAAQLLVSLQKAAPPLLSGTIVETTKLGLPDLSGSLLGASGADSDLSLQTFISGSHTLRIFYGGPDKQRVALLGQTSESDVVHNGTDLWTYSSTTRQVTHATLPKGDVSAEKAAPTTVAGMTPQAAAEKALAAIDPSTAVTVDRTAYVANRSAYQVLLTPRDTRSLVGSIRIALDSATSVPLRVQVFARGAASPAIQVGFTDITMGAPDASIFRFVKPAGTTVKQQKIPFMTDTVQTHLTGTAGRAPSDSKVIGTGWTAVAQMTLSGDSQGVVHGNIAGTLGKAGTRVAGGWVITSALLTAEITDDGRVFVGAISAADLEKVAASGQAP
ncbi:outer membrane lipoprotein carrier protein LolA [Acidothermaceae bacterium B102]|nr:outer membrane lipoprotein carrier protein LolA [Acidothermaceae bacterium B102]